MTDIRDINTSSRTIKDLHNPWRDKLRPASFRGATFHVEGDSRSGGRRGVVHEYPKRNDPYTEDMGRKARRFSVQGYLIGPNYLLLKDILISALEADGTGTLKLPLSYMDEDIEVLAGDYRVSQSRTLGGFCAFEMEFQEAGKPGFAVQTLFTPGLIDQAAAALEGAVTNQFKRAVKAVGEKI